MEDSKKDSIAQLADYTQKTSTNLKFKEIDINFFEANYTGGIIITTRSDLGQINTLIGNLKSENHDFKKENKDMEFELRSLRMNAKQDERKIELQKQEIKELREELSKFAKFRQSQIQGRKQVLTPKVKSAIQRGVKNRMTVIDIYNALVQTLEFDGAYETVRKYISDSKKENKWL